MTDGFLNQPAARWMPVGVNLHALWYTTLSDVFALLAMGKATCTLTVDAARDRPFGRSVNNGQKKPREAMPSWSA